MIRNIMKTLKEMLNEFVLKPELQEEDGKMTKTNDARPIEQAKPASESKYSVGEIKHYLRSWMDTEQNYALTCAIMQISNPKKGIVAVLERKGK